MSFRFIFCICQDESFIFCMCSSQLLSVNVVPPLRMKVHFVLVPPNYCLLQLTYIDDHGTSGRWELLSEWTVTHHCGDHQCGVLAMVRYVHIFCNEWHIRLGITLFATLAAPILTACLVTPLLYFRYSRGTRQ